MRKKYYSLLIGLIAVYIALTFAAPVNPTTLDTYNISIVQLRLILIALVLPILAIYFVAFYGFIAMKEYTNHIKNEPDGKGLSLLANGLGVLAVGLVVNSIVSGVVGIFTARNLDLVPTGVIISNYLSVALSLGTYLLIYRGSKALRALVPAERQTSLKTKLLVAGFVLFSAAFVVLALTNPDRSAEATATTRGLFYLPDWLLLSTVLLPYIASWYLGLAAASNIGYYRRKVNGIIYRSLLKNVGLGVTIIIFASISSQFINLFPRSIQSLSLSWLLAVFFVLLGVIAAGFVMLAVGAKKLRQLEGL